MTSKLIQATDVASGSFFLLLMAVAAATVLIVMGTGWVARRWKLPIALSGMATLVSTMFYWQAANVWMDNGQITIVYRYIVWLLTVPMQVTAMYFFINATARAPVGLFWRLLIVSVLMVLARYMGESSLMYPTLGFLIGLVGWLYVLGEFFFGRMSDINLEIGDEVTRRGYFWLRLILTIGWAIYPIVFFIARFGGGVEGPKLAVVYNLADLVNQVGFGLAMLTAGVKHSEYAR